jgi:hypothetical protein
VPGVYSVTEILNPPRIAGFRRTQEWWANPYDLVYATFGTAWHEVIASQRERVNAISRCHYTFEKENYFEKPLVVNGKEVILRGTPDQYNHTMHILTDYKTLKYFYDIYYIFEKNDWTGSTYHKQVNLYRWAKFPDCEAMQLEALVKDYNRRLKAQGITPIMRIAVPWIDDKEVEAMAIRNIGEIMEAEEDLSKARDCTEIERWKDNIRCREFCYVAETCPQWARLKEEKP